MQTAPSFFVPEQDVPVLDARTEVPDDKEAVPMAAILMPTTEKPTNLSMNLQGRTIALAEGRQLEDLAAMLERESADVFRCPMLSIFDHPDSERVMTWLRQLTAGRFTHVILLTGEGLRRLLSLADREGIREDVITALTKVQIITRGPKPVQALKEVKLTPTRIASAPTTEGVIATLKLEDLSGARVGVQLYNDCNQPLSDFLVEAGAEVFTVSPYVYAPSSDSERVADLIHKLADGHLDAIVFTSSPQIDRLFEVADEKHLARELLIGLQRVRVAAVGPVVKERLMARNVRADITPEQGFQMKNLVQHIKRALSR